MKKHSLHMAAFIAASRVARGWTQRMLGQRLDVEQGTISKIEDGTMRLHHPLYNEAAIILELDLNELDQMRCLDCAQTAFCKEHISAMPRGTIADMVVVKLDHRGEKKN